MGAGILLGSLLGGVLYFYLLFLSPWELFTLQLTAFLAVAAVFVILAWIGYTLATTPPPMPIEDFTESLEEEPEKEEEEKE
ncbi:MAG: transcriptional regulator [Candidatus Bathyarchaeia archaeon]